MSDMNKANSRGFTIVELLIVIVIIAVLASITIVSYNGIQQRSKNTARIAVGNQWVSAFQVYQATYDKMPPTAEAMAVGAKYCLGKGFPIGGGGVARCQNVSGTDHNNPRESDNATLMTELAVISGLPTAVPLRAQVTGPYLQRLASGYYVTIGVEGSGYTTGGDCGGGYVVQWTNGTNATTCYKLI